jgi:hypothetical protein
MTVTIDDLLNALQNLNQPNKLDNTRETWERIGRKDNFSELGLDDGELEQFLKEWIDNNPYSAL